MRARSDSERYLLECYSHTNLSGEWNSYRCSGAEEISQRAFGDFELLQAGKRYRLAAACIAADAADDGLPERIRHRLGLGNRKLHYVHSIVRARIVAVEEIEELSAESKLQLLD